MSAQTTPARALLTEARGQLEAAGIDSAPLEARLLLAHALDAAPDALLTEPDQPVSAAITTRFWSVVNRRLQREPLFYITGEREFYGLPFYVDARALIPRPETELLVEEAIAAAAIMAAPHTNGNGLLIADIGSGSGCIVVATASVLTGARFIATDISAGAVDVARANANRHGVADRITFSVGDLLEPLTERIDIIIANPPYIPAENLPTLQAEIRDHEPRVAIDGGAGGMTIAERLVRSAPGHLNPGGWLLMEVGYGQAPLMVDAAKEVFPPGSDIDMALDLAGIPRVVRVRVPRGE